MEQLKLGAVLQIANELTKVGMSMKEIVDIPIYLGNDDELNGIHTAWYGQVIDPGNEEDMIFVELINEDGHNIQCNGKSVLIS